jgi:hypothetical protein
MFSGGSEYARCVGSQSQWTFNPQEQLPSSLLSKFSLYGTQFEKTDNRRVSKHHIWSSEDSCATYPSRAATRPLEPDTRHNWSGWHPPKDLSPSSSDSLAIFDSVIE